MAISRSQLVKELEPGLNVVWNTKGMKISMLKFIQKNLLTELSKRK
jgi:hypothetical protein